MNRIPHPVNLVSKFIIIILTNFTGKSGAKNQGAAKEQDGNPENADFPRCATADAGGLTSRSGGRGNYFDNQCYL